MLRAAQRQAEERCDLQASKQRRIRVNTRPTSARLRLRAIPLTGLDKLLIDEKRDAVTLTLRLFVRVPVALRALLRWPRRVRLNLRIVLRQAVLTRGCGLLVHGQLSHSV